MQVERGFFGFGETRRFPPFRSWRFPCAMQAVYPYCLMRQYAPPIAIDQAGMQGESSCWTEARPRPSPLRWEPR